jgi:hypothetical protein
MSLFRSKIIRLHLAKPTTERPVHVGKIRAADYAEALRDPAVQARQARVIAKKRARPN